MHASLRVAASRLWLPLELYLGVVWSTPDHLQVCRTSADCWLAAAGDYCWFAACDSWWVCADVLQQFVLASCQLQMYMLLLLFALAGAAPRCATAVCKLFSC
jgi:hypothetical protein